MKKLSFILLLGITFFLSSCGSKSGPGSVDCSESWSQDVADEINALSDASLAYANDPTTENCKNYKKAYQNYIDALRSWEPCLTGTSSYQEWKNSLDNAESQLEDLC